MAGSVSDLNIKVFEITNTDFYPVNELEELEAVKFSEAYCGHDTFELWCPITERNASMLKRGRVLWQGTEAGYVIETIESSFDANKKQKVYDIQGKTLESYLTRRIIMGTRVYTNTPVHRIIEDLVSRVTDTAGNDPLRIIPYLVIEPNNDITTPSIDYQKTGGELYETIHDLAMIYELGFDTLS